MIKITVLNDNTPGRGLLAEHGLSFYIEWNNKNYLLDAGPGEVFKKNAQMLNIKLSELNGVILSHGHWDHGNGLEFLGGLPLWAHPDVFKKRYHSHRDMAFVGLKMDEAELERHFHLTLSAKALEIDDGIWFLGEIPRLNDFESKKTAFEDENGEPDFVQDDSGIAIVSRKGLVVISGCAHAGIINTINHAIQVTRQKKVYAVLGGFHLKTADEVTVKTINTLRQMEISHVYPSHCTDLPALSIFFNAFGVNQIRTGDVLTFE